MTRELQRNDSDSGFSLTELAVYILILGIISAIIAAVIVSLFRSEQTVSGVTNASNTSQVISTVLGNDIRNARAIKVSSNGITASVAGSDPASTTWECVQWTVAAASPAGENVLTRHAVADSGSVPANWGSGAAFATDLEHIGATPYFSGTDTVDTSPTQTGTVNYSFAFPTTGGATLQATGQLTNRVTSAGSKCW